VSLAAAVGAYWWAESALHSGAQSLMSQAHLNETYQAVYGQEVRDKNELVASQWKRVRSHLAVVDAQSSLPSRAAVSRAVHLLSTVPRVRAAELQDLQKILDKDTQHLRTQALASHTKYQ